MKTQLLDQADYQVLDSGNFTACLTDHQIKICRRLGNKSRNITRGSQVDCAAVIRQMAREIRDPLTIHPGFAFDFKWDPLSALLTTHSHMDLYIKACAEIGERFRLHIDSTGNAFSHLQDHTYVWLRLDHIVLCAYLCAYKLLLCKHMFS